MELIKYDKAKQALAEAHNFDEVKTIRDKAEAMKAYAKQANDKDMVMWASEIKVRAERKLGEMLRDSAESGERVAQTSGINQHDRVSLPATPSNDDSWPEPPAPRPVTLAEIGITRDQSSKFQKIAAMPQEHFETAVNMAKDAACHVSTDFILKAAQPQKSSKYERNAIGADDPLPEIKEIQRSPKDEAYHALYLMEELTKLTCENVISLIDYYSVPRLQAVVYPALCFLDKEYELAEVFDVA